MIPTQYNWTAYQGTTTPFNLALTNDDASPVDLSGYTAKMQARSSVTSGSVQLEASSEKGNLTINGPAGTIAIVFTADETAAISSSKLVYDLELISGGGQVSRLVYGEITVSKEVTR